MPDPTKADVIKAYTDADALAKTFADLDGTTEQDVNDVMTSFLGDFKATVAKGKAYPAGFVLTFGYKGSSTEQRWVRDEFYRGGWTKNPTLTELTNQANSNVTDVYDSTDRDMAISLFRRAAVPLIEGTGQWLVLDYVAQAFASISDPMAILNPNYGKGRGNSKRDKKTQSAKKTDSTTAQKTAEAKK